jgi:hypothetical protein
VKKPELVKMVQRQQAKWPTSKFIPSKATVANITAVLLDPKNGFTMNKPLITSPHPPKHARDKSVPVETSSQPPPASVISGAQSAAFFSLLLRNWKAQEDQDSETEVRSSVSPQLLFSPLPGLHRSSLP